MKKAFLLMGTLLMFWSCTTKPKIIACVGDSITAGARHKKQSVTAYPKVLSDLLGDDYSVVNLGRSGATALINGNLPYWNCKEFSNVFAVKPDVITIKLGTNDSKPQNWNAQDFKESYQSLIDTFQTISSSPKIYLCLPVPVYAHSKFKIDGTVVNQGVIPIIKSLATENNLSVIDLYEPFLDKEKLVPDGVHPEEEGAALMAKIMAQKLQ
ncbi:GDSL-type esterase/lipase family protein [Neotamlana sedimentorum]|uniref:GDSL-type esterase/lipase family protein n=1 Tax=Neotamlana sedimentorum TaxID=1435349 RepID=UPI000699C141|nr:GDSL-type esterase/lipase family protein [Tamlana sedimentorum]